MLIVLPPSRLLQFLQTPITLVLDIYHHIILFLGLAQRIHYCLKTLLFMCHHSLILGKLDILTKSTLFFKNLNDYTKSFSFGRLFIGFTIIFRTNFLLARFLVYAQNRAGRGVLVHLVDDFDGLFCSCHLNYREYSIIRQLLLKKKVTDLEKSDNQIIFSTG